MKQPKHKNQNTTNPPERILQFGEGNFLRAFFDFMIDELNEKQLFDGKIVMVQPIKNGLADEINAQNGQYTVILRGLENKKITKRQRRITCVSRCINPYTDFNALLETMENPQLRYIVSNTTEAGIAYHAADKITDTPPESFPGKITVLLHERYKITKGDPEKGFVFIPCELIDDNGTNLKEIVLRHAESWGLGQDFIRWVHNANYFTNTLVDRIVTGYPTGEAEALTRALGYADKLLTTGEIYHFFAIEEPPVPLPPFREAGLNVILTQDVTPYKIRKVRILNGAHTLSVLAAFLCGKNTVLEMMQDELLLCFIKKGLFDEIIPTLETEGATEFAEAVLERFVNPFIQHALLSISLNSVSKFKARVLPTLLDYQQQKGTLPEMLTLSFAALIAFYKGSERHSAKDEAEVLHFFKDVWEKAEPAREGVLALVKTVCARLDFWGMDLNEIPGFAEKTTEYLHHIQTQGMRQTLEGVLQ